MEDSFMTEEEAVFIVQEPTMIAPMALLTALCDGLADMASPTGFDVTVILQLHVPGDRAEIVEEAARRNGVRLVRV